MKKTSLFLYLVFICMPLYNIAQKPLSNYVNPIIGTQLSDTNTIVNFPIVGLPFGMNFWTPQTTHPNITYNYSDNKISGFRQTHRLDSHYDDFGAFVLMPMVDSLVTQKEKRAASYRHYSEKAYPYHYRVRFDNGINTEIVPTQRAAIMRFKFPYGGKSYIVLDVIEGKSKVEIIPAERKIVGYCTNGKEFPENFAKYFVIKFLRQFDDYGVWSDDSNIKAKSIAEGEAIGAWVMFELQANDVATVEISSSFISIEQAERNLEQELSHKTFETVKQQAQNSWDNALSSITVEGDENHQQLFYTAMYRSFLFPRIQHEFDPTGNPVHYSFYDGKLYNRKMYVDEVFNGGYSPLKPFFDLLIPELSADIMATYHDALSEGKNPDRFSLESVNIMVTNPISEIFSDDSHHTSAENINDTLLLNRKWLNTFTNQPTCKFRADDIPFFIFSSLGIYPQGSTFIPVLEPIFSKAILRLSDNKFYTLNGEENTLEYNSP